MKQTLIIIAIVLTCSGAICNPPEYQYVPFPTSEAVWSEVYYSGYSVDPPETIFERFALSGQDTIINGQAYMKLYLFQDDVFNPATANAIGGIREENRRIYYQGANVRGLKPVNDWLDYKEILLFDFSAEVGDTVWVNNDYPEPYHIVQNIDIIQLGGSQRRRYTVSPTGAQWVEGIGGLQRGLLFTSGALPTNGMNNSLICFVQNGEEIYFDNAFETCLPPAVGVEPQPLEPLPVRVVSNPSTNTTIIFDIDDAKIYQITIYNMAGKIVEQIGVKDSKGTVLHKHSLPPGLYLYVAKDLKGKGYSGKLVVQ